MSEVNSLSFEENIDSTIEVHRNRKYEPLVSKLCTEKHPVTKKPLFTFNKDLMVFAAMVGYTFDELEEVEDTSIKITLQTYGTDNKDSYIYLLALMEQKHKEEESGEEGAGSHILKNDSIRQSVKPFERYCNGGLKLIKQWFDENPGEIDPANILTNKLWEQLQKDHNVSIETPDPTDVQF